MNGKAKKEAIKQKKAIKEDIMKRLVFMRDNEQKSFVQITTEMIALQNEGVIPQLNLEKKTNKYWSNQYAEYKKKIASA